MKKLFLLLCLAALGASCRTTADVSASTEPCEADCAMPCCEEEGECTAEMKAECQGESECSSEAKVCPVTGKSLE
jgi:hypothetical protein